MKKTILTTVISLFITISAFAYSGGNGTEQYPYLISSQADMVELATNVNGGQSYAGVYFLLTRDLIGVNDTITTVIGYTNEQYFGGIFDGGGHEINVNISSTGPYVGIFGYVSDATIKNLGVMGNVTRSIYLTSAYAGSVCGYAESSTITNCYNMGSISSLLYANSPSSPYPYSICSSSGGICGCAMSTTISNCYNTGNISSSASFPSISNYNFYSYSGGICGYASSIFNCYNTGNISSTSTSSSYGSYSGYSYSGGICGRDGTIQNCFVSNCQITNTNDISQSRIGRIGGDIIYNYMNCYADITVSLNGNPIGNQDENSKNGKDALTANFQSPSWLQSTLGWDFSIVWCIKEKEQLPELQMQYSGYLSASIVFNLPEISYGDQIALDAVSNNTTTPILITSSDSSVAEVIGNLLIAKKAGNVTITAFQPSGNNFFVGENAINVAIQKKELKVIANPANAVYGDAMPQYSCQYSGFVSGDNESILTKLPTLTCSATSQSNAGTYIIVPAGAESINYSFTYINDTLTIEKRNLQVIPNNASRVYGYANPSFSLSYNGFVNGDNDSKITSKPVATTTATLTSNVGDYPIISSGGNATNYSFTYETGTLTITKAPLTVSVSSTSRLYGATNPVFTVNYSGFRNGETKEILTIQPQAVCLETPVSDVGSYPITISGGSATNYDFTYINGTLTITKASLTITAENKTREQGQPNPEFTLAYNGFKNNENASVLDVLPTISCTANINSPVGFYDIVLSGGSDNNYQYTLVNGRLEVTNTTGVETVERNNIKIYPNPAKDKIFIKSELLIKKVEIYSSTGTLLLSDNNFNGKIPFSSFLKGIYLVRVYTDNGITISKIVKK